MTTLSSSAPSSSRSSMMSAVPSTPSTPGRDKASDMRSSRSTRSAMAIGRAPARSAPRGGVGRDEEDLMVHAEQRVPAVAPGGGLGDGLRAAGARLEDALELVTHW